jgi:molybdopterin-synthase adenylyltransferase
MSFDYSEMTSRNLGFVSAAEQERLRQAHVFVAGVGGMGGAAVACLVRAGVGRLTIADIDVFELSNLNRQVFANLDSVGADKAAATAAAIARINPECQVRVLGREWVERLDEILPGVDVALNGCDDARATIALMRRAAVHRRAVVDAFASPLPNVYVVGPDDARPEERFGYPTVGKALADIDAELAAACLAKEIEYVMVHSSSAEHIELDLAAELIAGKRKRMSFAPMVWSTSCLMSYEAVRVILGKPGGPGPGGIFFNPWTHRVERPRGPIAAAVRRYFVRRFLAQLATRPPRPPGTTDRAPAPGCDRARSACTATGPRRA